MRLERRTEITEICVPLHAEWAIYPITELNG